MTTRAKAKLNDLLDLPGMTEMPGFHPRRTLDSHQPGIAARSTSVLLEEPRKRHIKNTQNLETNLELETIPEPETEISFPSQAGISIQDLAPQDIISTKPKIPAKPATNNNRRVLRLSPESRDILKLLKKNLRLTYDQQIQFLGQLVLYHELLPETVGLLIQERVRELRRFSTETTANLSPHRPEDLRLTKPLPLDNLLATLEERCAHLQKQVETLTKAIDAKTELHLLGLELAADDYSNENQLPALA
jgi:hypothetical protein